MWDGTQIRKYNSNEVFSRQKWGNRHVFIKDDIRKYIANDGMMVTPCKPQLIYLLKK